MCQRQPGANVAGGRPKHVVANCDESEPGTFKDRIVMEHDPFAVIEALTVAGGGITANLRLLDLERYFREDQASRITSDIREVTGRDPRRFARYIHDCASSLQ